MLNNLLKKVADLVNADESLAETISGSFWAFAGLIIATGLGLVSTIVIARFFGAHMLGVIAIMQAISFLAVTLAAAGSNTTIVRLIPEHVVRHSPTSAFLVYRSITLFSVGMAVVIGVVLYFASGFLADEVFNKPRFGYYIALLSGFVVFVVVAEINIQAIRGLRLIRVYALLQVLPFALMVVALFAFVYWHGAEDSPVFAQLIAWSGSAVIGAAIAVRAFKTSMSAGDDILPVQIVEILEISLPILVTTLLTWLMGQVGIILLGIYNSEADVGYYSIAVKLATIASALLGAVNVILAPKISQLFHDGKMPEALELAQKSAALVFWASAPILVILLGFGKPILSMLYGTEFLVAFPAMALLVVGQFANTMSGSTAFFMNMTGNQAVLRNIVAGAAVANVALGIYLVPRFGLQGAAIAATAGVIIWNFVTLVYIWRRYRRYIGYIPFISRVRR